MNFDEFTSVRLDVKNNAIIILDQTKLPGNEVYLKLTTPTQIWEAIRSLRVRGAPAIGITAAFGVYLAVNNLDTDSLDEFKKSFVQEKQYLAGSRPTAVNLFWALDAMEKVVNSYSGSDINDLKKLLLETAKSIAKEDAEVCRKIGEFGLSLIKDGDGLLTHCNAGALATAKYGTALAPIYLGMEQGMRFHIFMDETRPLLQGARLTAYELSRIGADATLICDNMASSVMKSGKVQAVFVGCDRVAANGDTANKIGTSGVAVLAKYYNIPFYVCAPTSSIDMKTKSGNEIEIEQRPAEEVTELMFRERMAPIGINVYNPAFDVTDAGLITAMVTERGIIYPPFTESLPKLLGKDKVLTI